MTRPDPRAVENVVAALLQQSYEEFLPLSVRHLAAETAVNLVTAWLDGPPLDHSTVSDAPVQSRAGNVPE